MFACTQSGSSGEGYFSPFGYFYLYKNFILVSLALTHLCVHYTKRIHIVLKYFSGSSSSYSFQYFSCLTVKRTKYLATHVVHVKDVLLCSKNTKRNICTTLTPISSAFTTYTQRYRKKLLIFIYWSSCDRPLYKKELIRSCGNAYTVHNLPFFVVNSFLLLLFIVNHTKNAQ